LSAFDSDIEVFEEDFVGAVVVLVFFGQGTGGQDDVAGPLGFGEREAEIGEFEGAFDGLCFGAVEPGLSAFGLLCALSCFEMGDEGLFFFESCFLFFVGAKLDHAAFDALFSERGVVAGVVDESGLFDFDDAVDDFVEHVAVVADEDDGAFEVVAEESFEPFSALDIEVVCWFVEEEDGGVLEEEFAQGDSCFLSA